MIRILVFLAALFTSTAAWAQQPVQMQCLDPNGGAGSQWVPCQPSNAAALGNLISGTGMTTSSGATTIIAAQGAGIKMRITGVQCGRDDAGTTAIHVTLSDTVSTVLVIPNNGGGGGNNAVFSNPLVVAANAAFTYTPSSGITNTYCNAQGYQSK
jgi:hypothetical protein